MLGNHTVDALRRRTASFSKLLDEFISSGSLDNAREEVQRAEHRHALRDVLGTYAAGPAGRDRETNMGPPRRDREANPELSEERKQVPV